MAAQTRAAGGSGDDAAGIHENVGIPTVHALAVHALGGGDDDAPDAGSQMMTLQHGGSGRHVRQLTIGAGADDNLVDGNFRAVGGRMGVFRQVRPRHGAVHCGQVNVDGTLVLGIGIGLHRRPGTGDAAFHIGAGYIIHGENAVFGTGLDGHIADGQPVIDGQLRNAGAGKFQRLIPGAVHTDHADEGENHILAGDEGTKLAGEVDANGGGNLEPRLASRHGRTHIGGADAGGKRAQRAIGAGMGIGADDGLTGGYQPFFRQERMLDAHLAHIIVVIQIKFPGKGAALLALCGGLDVLVGGEMVHNHGDSAFIKNLGEAICFKLVDGHGGGNIVAHDQIQLCLNQLAGTDRGKPGVAGQNFLGHCHCHCRFSFLSRRFLQSFC